MIFNKVLLWLGFTRDSLGMLGILRIPGNRRIPGTPNDSYVRSRSRNRG